MITVLSIDKLRAARGFELSTALVLGAETLLDGGGGLFTWDPECELDDDGVDVIAFPRELIGRWRRVENVGLILKSPSGHFWRVTVGDTGVLATTDLGTTLDGGE